MLAEDGFHPAEVLTQAVGFAQGLFVIVGHRRQKRGHFDLVEAAKNGAETLLSEI
jgi:hypothetical protein